MPYFRLLSELQGVVSTFTGHYCLGEINDRQQGAWGQTLEVFDEGEQRARRLSLFPEDRAIPADALDGVQVKLREMELRRPRAFGNCWLGCELWQQLGLGAFWEERLG